MKKIIVFNLFVAITFVLFISCKIEPKAIAFGKDHCAMCDMMVVDRNHAAEYVTKKGKTYIFDATECLVMKINKEQNEDKMAFILVTDYDNPENLVAAKQAIFLVSEKIKSPMGANLAAFKSKVTAQKYQQKKGGMLFNWDELKVKLSNLR